MPVKNWRRRGEMMTQVVRLLPCERRSRDILASAPLNRRGVRVKNEPEKWVLTDYLHDAQQPGLEELYWKIHEKFHLYYVGDSFWASKNVGENVSVCDIFPVFPCGFQRRAG